MVKTVCVWPIKAPPVYTGNWDRKAWETFEDGFRPKDYTGGRDDQKAWKEYLASKELNERVDFYAKYGMKVYKVRFVHRISPSNSDVADPIALSDADLKQLPAVLRKAKLLLPGQRCQFRSENNGQRLVVFPGGSSIWHSIILEQVLPATNG